MPGNIGPQNLVDILAQAVIQATITGSSTPYDDQVTVGTEAAALPNRTLQNGATITADPTNPNGSYVYYGNAGGQHTPLAPGQSATIHPTNLNLIYVYGSQADLLLDIYGEA